MNTTDTAQPECTCDPVRASILYDDGRPCIRETHATDCPLGLALAAEFVLSPSRAHRAPRATPTPRRTGVTSEQAPPG